MVVLCGLRGGGGALALFPCCFLVLKGGGINDMESDGFLIFLVWEKGRGVGWSGVRRLCCNVIFLVWEGGKEGFSYEVICQFGGIPISIPIQMRARDSLAGMPIQSPTGP